MPTTGDAVRPAERLARRAFVVALGGLPVWWLLGVAAFVPLALAVCLGWDLRTRVRGRTVAPPHFGWWLLFLAWVVLGAGTLFAVAPGSADDAGAGRVLVFGYRLAWYAACTVVLVWLSSTSAKTLPDRTVHRVLALVFGVAVVGGILGLLVPELAVTTLSERLLPSGLRANSFVASLVSAEASDVQTVLGDPEPRPKAPFPFTNTWGSVISLTVVFFLALVRSSAPRLRWLATPVLAVAAVPVVISLNRGLWLALAAGALGLLVLLALRRRTGALLGLVAVVLLCGAVLTETPLGDTIGARLDNPHSNERRSQLLVATVDSMTEGSPLVGYGGTRDVEGSFASIAGGATPECPACGVPPLGTQGQLWLVLFSQGWLGALFFVGFFVLSLRRTWRCRTPNQTVATFVLAIFLLQLTVYDTLGMPMLVVMVALGLTVREGATVAWRPPVRKRDAATIATIAIVGATVATVAATDQTVALSSSTVSVELEPAATYLDSGRIDLAGLPTVADAGIPRPATIDTEAAVLRSQPVLVRSSERTGVPRERLAAAVRVSAPPHSMVMEVTVTLPATEDSAAVAAAVVDEYVAERRRVLAEQRSALRTRLLAALAATDASDIGWADARAHLQAALDRLAATPVSGARVLRGSGVVDATRHPWVAATSGLAFGMLVGLALVRLGPALRRLR